MMIEPTDSSSLHQPPISSASSSTTMNLAPTTSSLVTIPQARTPQIGRRLGTSYRVPRTAAQILSEIDFIPQCFHKVMPPRQYPHYEVSIWSDIGKEISV